MLVLFCKSPILFSLITPTSKKIISNMVHICKSDLTLWQQNKATTKLTRTQKKKARKKERKKKEKKKKKKKRIYFYFYKNIYLSVHHKYRYTRIIFLCKSYSDQSPLCLRYCFVSVRSQCSAQLSLEWKGMIHKAVPADGDWPEKALLYL